MKYLKRIMALALACLIVISLVPPTRVSAASGNAVTFLTNNGILRGFGGGNLGLEQNLTREQFVMYLHRVAGEPAVQGYSRFTDVQIGADYYDAVLWAQKKEITNGVSTTRFGVGSYLTYEQVLTFLYRFGNSIFGTSHSNMKKGSVPKGYTNYNSSGKCPEMLDALAWAYYKKLLTGTNTTNIKVGTNVCTRGDAVQLIYNFYKAFRKTYALAACTNDAYDGMGNPNPGLMSTLFNNYLTHGKTVLKGTGATINSKTQLKAAFKEAFSNATCIDVCYFYINSHGGPGAGLTDKELNTWLSTSDLKKLVDSYPAKFVIMIEACYSGQFVTYFKNTGSKADIICAANSTQPSHALNMKPTNLTELSYAIATACWREALLGNSSPSVAYYHTTERKFKNYTMANADKGDGFVSIKELAIAVKPAVNAIAKSKGNVTGQSVCYYSPSSQPAYCAFGNLD